MKKISRFIVPLAAVLCLASCDKGFQEKNQNPYNLINVDPNLMFSTVERNLSVGNWETEQTIVQQFVNAYNAGATTGFNFNASNNNFNQPTWNQSYNNPVKYLQQIMFLVKDDPTRSNLMQMSRILRAYTFMVLVDSYGDVPYSQAGKAFQEGITLPKYDKSADIYADIYKELKEASAALSTTGTFVAGDVIYGTGRGFTSVAAQVSQWKKLGYSLMLRLGMRYSKLDATKAQSIVQEAVAGGVMTVNNDNMVLLFNTVDANPLNQPQRTTNPFNYYMAEPFVNQLKMTRDPRSKYLVATFANPNNIGVAPVDTVTANQFGFPIGYDDKTILAKPDYRGAATTGFKYSQLNFFVFGSATAPVFFVTLAQTKLLLAEAAIKNWIPGGFATANTLYREGIRASMDEYAMYPNALPIPDLNYQSYAAQPSVALTPANALQMIGTEYWIASVGNGHEGFANFRRTGFPLLTPNNFNNNLNGGFARRTGYPQGESSTNTANYNAAVASMGGDGITQRVFWDIP
jgi:hypothetical protein